MESLCLLVKLSRWKRIKFDGEMPVKFNCSFDFELLRLVAFSNFAAKYANEGGVWINTNPVISRQLSPIRQDASN